MYPNFMNLIMDNYNSQDSWTFLFKGKIKLYSLLLFLTILEPHYRSKISSSPIKNTGPMRSLGENETEITPA